MNTKPLVLAAILALASWACLLPGDGLDDSYTISKGEMVNLTENLSDEGFTIVYFGADW